MSVVAGRDFHQAGNVVHAGNLGQNRAILGFAPLVGELVDTVSYVTHDVALAVSVPDEFPKEVDVVDAHGHGISQMRIVFTQCIALVQCLIVNLLCSTYADVLDGRFFHHAP